MYITFVAYWVVGFPISYYLGIHTNLKAVGVWLGLLAGLTAAALFLFIRFHYITKNSLQLKINQKSLSNGLRLFKLVVLLHLFFILFLPLS